MEVLRMKVCIKCGTNITWRGSKAKYCKKCARQNVSESQLKLIKEHNARSLKYKNKILYLYDRKCAICKWSLGGVGNKPSNGLEIHHVRPVTQGGEDNIENLILLCPNCHKMAHTAYYNEKFLKGFIKTELTIEEEIERKAAASRRIDKLLNLFSSDFIH